LIDSGAAGLILAAPFARANRVLDSVGMTIAASALGFGGESIELAGRVEGFQLGPYVLRRPVTMFSQDTKGLLSSTDLDALVGGEILSRFIITFDYQNQRILFQPAGHFENSFRADASGLSLRTRSADFERFEIDDVEPDSAAAMAGLRRGDVMIAIDGHPARELNLDKLRKILQQSGRSIRLEVERNGKAVNATLKLKARI
jgi:hypothetical protein